MNTIILFGFAMIAIDIATSALSTHYIKKANRKIASQAARIHHLEQILNVKI